jgi:N6-L-threonylcarbamoyladenine synthase
LSVYLGIESSCDETSIAFVRDGKEILAHDIASQAKLHAPFHGVVPELASRAHLQNIFPLLEEVSRRSGISLKEIDGLGVTSQPGLLGALLVGVSVAKALAFTLQKPLYGVHHIYGHIYATHLEHEVPYPYLSLVVSGGHTALYLVHAPLDLTLLGKTVDDAAGESFDKVAKILGLGYPGGPLIDRLSKEGNPTAYSFPRTHQKKKQKAGQNPLNFSFSGLKTAVLYQLFGQDQTQNSSPKIPFSTADVAASFQEAVVDTLVQKSLLALEQYSLKRMTLVGGVACNSRLRAKLKSALCEKQCTLYYPSPLLCTDNAAMIAGLTYHLAQKTPSLASLDLIVRP